MLTVSTETMLSPLDRSVRREGVGLLSVGGGAAQEGAVEPDRGGGGPPPLCADSVMPVSFRRRRSGRGTRCFRCGSRSRRRTGGQGSRVVVLLVVVLSATCQLESSNPGWASGDSWACFQLVSAGSVTVAAVGTTPTLLPVCVTRVRTFCPFQVTSVAPLNTSRELCVSVSPSATGSSRG